MEKFYIGLDIGTESVGIAATDERYRLLRAKRKDLWAVRLFDEAKSAADRRTKRTARRRLQRRAQRIDLLQSLFADQLEDSLFFIRLNNSGFWAEDKDGALGGTKFSLFQDPDFTDRDFHRRYPTIFHLRQALMAGAKRYDLRLYYLAIHHIVKYRGHFLFEGENGGQAIGIGKVLEQFNNTAQQMELSIKPLTLADEKGFFERVCMCKGLRDKASNALALFAVDATDKQTKEWIALAVGSSAKPAILFDNESYADLSSVSFAKLSEENLLALAPEYGEDFDMLLCAKAIYDYMRFAKVLKEYRHISDAMVAIYQQHHADLAKLKALLKKTPDLYKEVFRATDKQTNYANYVGHTSKNNTKKKVKKCKSEDFFKYLTKLLASNQARLAADPAYNEIMSALAEDNFLPKILHADNGLFPHQINGDELDQILRNLCRDYPQFAEIGQNGLSLCDKIKSIFLFRIPYYVGPLNTHHSGANGEGNSWMVRKQEGKILPWNFDAMVDHAQSNQAFMRRMTAKCTYWHGKDVLPKCSLLYQEYKLLNQLNKLRINEEPIDVQLKQELFENLYKTQAKVRLADIKQYLVRTGRIAEREKKDLSLSGLDDSAKLSLSSYVMFKRILGGFVNKRPDICEDIILWHTLNTNKSLVENLIKDHYGDIPEIAGKLRELKGLTFKEFGNLSKEFLCELPGGVDDVTGEVYTIVGELYNTNQNLNEILNDKKYTFDTALQEANGLCDKAVTYEDVEELYVSPLARRGIWQALQMTDEYVQAVGRAPDKIFVEVTRNTDEKKKGKRTESRHKTLVDIYTAAKILNTDMGEKLLGCDDFALRQERLYLWFLQQGRCAYTGKPIDLEQINGEMYDVDHIVPRSLIKDDSIDNKVLVLREKNQQKGDTYPLPVGFSNQQPLWKTLKSIGAKDAHLMSDKKYRLLMRTAPLTEEDLQGFIERQLVVTNQTVKAVAELLQRKYGGQGCKIVYSKAANVTNFRDKFNLVKCRETNDLHHARDAYLNVVVGNVYDSTFSSWREYYYRNATVRKNIRLAPTQEEKDRIQDAEAERQKYNLRTLFYKNNRDIWQKDADIATVKSVMAKHSMMVTRYAFIEKGAFYDETIYNKNDNPLYPRKGKGPLADTTKYGGYKIPKTAFFVVVQSVGKKGKVVKSIEAIDVLTYYKTGTDIQKIQRALAQKGIQEPKVLTVLKKKALLLVNGTFCYLAGITGVQILLHNAVEWYTNDRQDLYVKNIAKLLGYVKEKTIKEEDLTKDTFEMRVNNKKEVKVKINKTTNAALYRDICLQFAKKEYEGLTSLASFAQKVVGCKQIFDSLTTLEQCRLLMQFVKILQCNAETADLSLLNDGKTCGLIRIPKNINSLSIAVVDRSPCGLIERIRQL